MDYTEPNTFDSDVYQFELIEEYGIELEDTKHIIIR